MKVNPLSKVIRCAGVGYTSMPIAQDLHIRFLVTGIFCLCWQKLVLPPKICRNHSFIHWGYNVFEVFVRLDNPGLGKELESAEPEAKLKLLRTLQQKKIAAV